MARWFITGTDTDAGKTAVTAALAAGLRHSGVDVRAVKPLMSGHRPENVESDAYRIASAAGHSVACHTWWETPISPHRAAWVEEKSLDIQDLRKWITTQTGEHVLIEGVGGWRVPLAMRPSGETLYTVSDLARDANGEVLVVAANKLGVLNHVTLTVEAIQREGFTVRGVILNQVNRDEDSISEKTNLADLQHLLQIKCTPFPFINDFNSSLLKDEGLRLCAELAMV